MIIKGQINLVVRIFAEAQALHLHGDWPSLKLLQLYAEACCRELKCTTGVGQSQIYMCGVVSKFIAHMTIYLCAMTTTAIIIKGRILNLESGIFVEATINTSIASAWRLA